MSRSMRTRALSLSESARVKGVSNFSSGASIPPAFSSSVFSCFASSLKSSKGTGFAVGEDCAVGADDKHAPMLWVVECSRVRVIRAACCAVRDDSRCRSPIADGSCRTCMHM